jgi:hypothetical protein
MVRPVKVAGGETDVDSVERKGGDGKGRMGLEDSFCDGVIMATGTISPPGFVPQCQPTQHNGPPLSDEIQ